jgi:hypothetical protein
LQWWRVFLWLAEEIVSAVGRHDEVQQNGNESANMEVSEITFEVRSQFGRRRFRRSDQYFYWPTWLDHPSASPLSLEGKESGSSKSRRYTPWFSLPRNKKEKEKKAQPHQK